MRTYGASEISGYSSKRWLWCAEGLSPARLSDRHHPDESAVG